MCDGEDLLEFFHGFKECRTGHLKEIIGLDLDQCIFEVGWDGDEVISW